jgi:hypothetical protein
MYLFQNGIKTIDELIEGLEHQGFTIAGRASKTISDALRTEMRRRRVWRRGRGLYGPADMPRSTEYRIHKRVLELRREATGTDLTIDRWR